MATAVDAPSTSESGTVTIAAEVAHVFRRCTFGPFPGRVDRSIAEIAGASDPVAQMIVSLIDAPALPFDPPADIDGDFDTNSEQLDIAALVPWWIERMRSDDAGLHETMMWFWHTHFTTSHDKANSVMCWRQLRLLHEHALGNFADLLKAITVDAAMLVYLDGDGSRAGEPNENYARELMELFALGRNQYTQRDVHAAAVALAGWGVNWETGQVEVHPEHRSVRPVRLFGRRRRYSAESVVEAVLDRPACGPFIVAKMWDHFIGGDRDDRLIDQWAQQFRSDGWELRPLMTALLTSEAFRSAHLTRPRSTIEWFVAMTRVLDHDDYGPWDLDSLGQLPYAPPNVAGWPGSRWTSSSTALARAGYLSWFELARPDTVAAIAAADDPVASALDRCSLFEVSESTERALRSLSNALAVGDEDDVTIGSLLLRTTVLTPEFALA